MDFDDLYNLDFRWWLLSELGSLNYYLMKLDVQKILDITPPGIFAWYDEFRSELQIRFLEKLNHWHNVVSENE